MSIRQLSSVATTTGLPAPVQGHMSLYAYGDPDDHLRLCAILAQELGGLVSGSLKSDADACLDPTNSWRARLAALTSLLQDVPVARLNGQIVLVDIDALSTGSIDNITRWEDSYFKAARAELMQTLIAAARRGAWHLVRPAPESSVSALIEDAGIPLHRASEPIRSDVTDIPRPRALQPEVRQLFDWLLAREVLTQTSAQDLADIMQAETLSLHLVTLVYDSLRPSIRKVANRLAVLRPPQSINGHYGPFPISNSGAPGDAIPRTAFVELVACGFLQRVSATTQMYCMPRSVRQTLTSTAETLVDPAIHQEHAHLSDGATDRKQIERSIEIHHHAIQAGNASRAAETALFYVSDLRPLGVALSRQSKWMDAAGIFEAIVSQDVGDAYAWEYLGYNLARANYHKLDGKAVDRVIDAFSQAVKLEPHNPLFSGRLLGMRAELGQDVFPDFGRQLAEFYQLYGEDGMTFFAEAVINGFRRGRRDEDLRALRTRWKSILLQSARLSRLLNE